MPSATARPISSGWSLGRRNPGPEKAELDHYPLRSVCPSPTALAPEALSTRPGRRRLKNFSRNRPETTNLNHQYAIRCVFIDPSSCRRWPARSGIAPKPADKCEMLHISQDKLSARPTASHGCAGESEDPADFQPAV